MNRYYLPPSQWTDSCLTLPEDEARHCAQVLRQREGDEIEIFDGEGRSARCLIEVVSKKQVRCQVREVSRDEAPSRKIQLLQSIPKGKNMEWIIQKAVELGVSEIVPLQTDHSVVLAKTESDRLKKLEKWQRVALEACKQCGQNFLVKIHPIGKLSDRVTTITEVKLVGSLQPGAVPLREKVRSFPPSCEIALAVGPEGDFSDSEYAELAEAGFAPVSLGPLVLRVETASFVLLTAASLF